MTSWDDLKYLLATIQQGSFSAAGKALGVNRTTVARRVAVLEKQLGAVLLEQTANGYDLTPAGEQAVASARELDRQINQLEQSLLTEGVELSGLLRVAAPLGLGPEFMPELAQFSANHPRLEVELLNTIDPVASVNQRKADVGIAVCHELPDFLQGYKVVDLERAIYGSKAYLKKFPADLPLSQHRWISWGKEMAHTQVAQWMQHHISADAEIPLRVNSWHALRESVINSAGVGHLWCFLADGERRLVKISEVIPDLTVGLWVCHLRDVDNRKIAAFSEVMLPLLAERVLSVG